MPDETHVPITLRCHSVQACPAVRSLTVSVRVLASGRLWLSYALDADLDRPRIPAEDTARRAHELWTHTCFEAFVSASGEASYCELNVAPSKAWALYRFSAPRQRMTVVRFRTGLCGIRPGGPTSITPRASRSSLIYEIRYRSAARRACTAPRL